MNRREALAAFLALAAEPLRAQSRERVRKVHVLSNAAADPAQEYMRALEARFRDLGYVRGRNLVLEWHFAEGRPERMPALAAQVVAMRPDVLITISNAETAAAKKATSAIPIVMALGADPVRAGLVASLARPGGNITGVTSDASTEILAKQVELLTEVRPSLQRVALLWDPGVPGFDGFVGTLMEAARQRSVTVRSVEVRKGDELEGAFRTIVRGGAEALFAIANVLIFNYRQKIADFTVRQKLPAITYMREFVEAGFLMSYGANLLALFPRAAQYSDRILKGAKPSDLPIEQPTQFELVLNLRTARSLGITIPQPVLLRADRVIE